MYFKKSFLLAAAYIVASCKAQLSVPVETLSDVEAEFIRDREHPEIGHKFLFLTWARRFEKSYSCVHEAEQRYNVWRDSVKQVEEHNKKDEVTYKLEVNHFADMTHEEFATTFLMDGQDCSATGEHGDHVLSGKQLPDSVDWRTTGIVSPVKNQGHCGSCWTFSTTGALEAHTAKATGKHILLSEQQLVDCAQAFKNNGCHGGLPSQAFEYVMYNGGLDTEYSYPYKAADGKCDFNKGGVGATVTGVHNITQFNEDELVDAVAHVGPVSVAFQVASDFRLYKSGVYNSKECKSGPKDVNHAVLAVGYGVEDGSDYWLVKNSWGKAWGIDGYFHIARGSNECGIATCASYPVV